MQSYSAHIVILTLFNTKPYYLVPQPPQISSRAHPLVRLLFSSFLTGIQGFPSLALGHHRTVRCSSNKPPGFSTGRQQKFLLLDEEPLQIPPPNSTCFLVYRIESPRMAPQVILDTHRNPPLPPANAGVQSGTSVGGSQSSGLLSLQAASGGDVPVRDLPSGGRRKKGTEVEPPGRHHSMGPSGRAGPPFVPFSHGRDH